MKDPLALGLARRHARADDHLGDDRVYLGNEVCLWVTMVCLCLGEALPRDPAKCGPHKVARMRDRARGRVAAVLWAFPRRSHARFAHTTQGCCVRRTPCASTSLRYLGSAFGGGGRREGTKRGGGEGWNTWYMEVSKLEESTWPSQHGSKLSYASYRPVYSTFMLLFATYTYHWRIGSGFGLLCAQLKQFFCLPTPCTLIRATPERMSRPQEPTSFLPSQALSAFASHSIHRSINRKRRQVHKHVAL